MSLSKGRKLIRYGKKNRLFSRVIVGNTWLINLWLLSTLHSPSEGHLTQGGLKLIYALSTVQHSTGIM